MPLLRTLAVLTPALLLSQIGCVPANPSAPVLFGHIAALRDDGSSAQRGIRLAVEQAGKESGRPVKVLHVDPRGKLETLESEAVRLVSVNRVQALLGGATAQELERLDRARVVVISPCGFRPAVLSDHVFCTGLSPAFQGQVLARFAREELKAAKVAVLVDERREESRLLADAFARTWAAVKDAAPVTVLRFDKDAKFDELAKRLKADAPAALLFAGTPEDLRTFLLNQPPLEKSEEPRILPLILFGGDEGSQPLLLRESATRTGIHLVTAFVKDDGTPRMKEFAADYLKTFQEEPDATAALAYDNARLLFEAQRRSGDGGKMLREELAALKDFASLSGPLTFDKEYRAQRPAYVVKLDDGKAQTVKRYAPPAH